VIIVLEHLYRERMRLYSAELIREWQKYNSSALQEFVSETLAFIADKYGLALIHFAIFQFTEKKKSFFLFLTMCVSLFINLSLKLYYVDARPFFEYSFVTPGAGCPLDYGNPSGHSLVSVTYFSLCYTLLVEENDNLNKHFKRVVKILLIVFLGAVAISRVHVGVHHISQVIYGLAWGYYLYVVLMYFRDFLYSHIKQIDEGILVSDSKRRYFVLTLFIIFTAGFSIYAYRKMTFTNPELWVEQVKFRCPKASNIKFEDYCMTRMMIGISIFGAYIGYHFHAKFVQANPEVLKFKAKYFKWFSLIQNAIISAIIGIPVLAVPKSSHLIIIASVKNLVPFFLVGLYLYGFADRFTMFVYKKHLIRLKVE